MKNYSITQNFSRFFRIRFANTKKLKHEAFKIRYGVYSEELGWEDSNHYKMEIDDFDDYSYHCLLEHTPTATFAGCIRLVIPPVDRPRVQLPFEKFCLESTRREIIMPEMLQRGSFGEISRLAVLSKFRRRLNEKNKPFIFNEDVDSDPFSEEERRNFPHISLGLYLATIGLSQLCNHQGMFMMMEPRLKRRLQKFGLNFVQAGNEMDYHGCRALFYFEMKNATSDVSQDIIELHQFILDDLRQQINLVPFNNPSDR